MRQTRTTGSKERERTKAVARIKYIKTKISPSFQCIAEQTEVGDRHVFTADSLLPAFM